MSDLSPKVAAISADSTRERLIEAITQDGPITAGELAERFGLTGAAVRRHLIHLESEGVIEERPENAQRTRGRGRPRKEFVLAAASHQFNSTETAHFALLALEELERRGGNEALVNLAAARTTEWENELQSRLSEREHAGEEVSQADRVSEVIDILQERGYAASLRPVTVTIGTETATTPARTLTTVQLCQGRCPVQDIAEHHPELCETETAALSRMLGVPVQRLATRAAGAHVCTTHLTPAMSQEILAASARGELKSEVTPDLHTEGRKP